MSLVDILFFAGFLIIAASIGISLVRKSRRLRKYSLLIGLLAILCTLASLQLIQQKTLLYTPASPTFGGGVQQVCSEFKTTLPCQTGQVLYRGLPVPMTVKALSGAAIQNSSVGTRTTLAGSILSQGAPILEDYTFYFIIICLGVYLLTPRVRPQD